MGHVAQALGRRCLPITSLKTKFHRHRAQIAQKSFGVNNNKRRLLLKVRALRRSDSGSHGC